MEHNLLSKQNKKKSVFKKIACIGLGMTTIFSMMPLSVHALSKNNEAYKGKEKVVEEIYPGEVFTTGDYVIKGDIKVVQRKPGENGIEIKGDVKFIIEKNNSLEVIAGKGEGAQGGGAGICLSRGNVLTLEGEGKLYVKGGDGAKGQPGEPGEPGEVKYVGEEMLAKPGDSGIGGVGGGGAGAAIGTPGGNGGQPGAKIERDWIPAMPGSTYNASKGTDGRQGEKSKEFGSLVIHGNMDLKADAGKGDITVAKAGEPGGDFKYYAQGDDGKLYLCAVSGGAGGGAGGNGFDGANIGCGGSGGGAGGTGGCGLCDGSRFSSHVFEGHGGTGGRGIGLLSSNNKGDKGGCFEDDDFELIYAGDGGEGGLPTASVECGCVYDARGYENALPSAQGKTEYDGKESPKKRVIKNSDCVFKIKDAQPGNIYPYTGEPIEPGVVVVDKRTDATIPRELYKVTYLDNVEIGKATINVQGVDAGNRDIPVIVSEDDLDICGDANLFFTIK